MSRARLAALLLALGAAVSASAVAADAAARTPVVFDDLLRPAPAEAGKPRLSFDDLVRPSGSPATVQGAGTGGCEAYAPRIARACEESQAAAFAHAAWKLDYARRAYEAHHIYTMIVFVLVCSLVGLGMWLSFKEFERAGRRPRRSGSDVAPDATGIAGTPAARPDGGAEAGAVNSIEASTSGVKVSSPVLGIIILVVSMGFFYLYLKTVYPIEEAAPAATPSVAAAK